MMRRDSRRTLYGLKFVASPIALRVDTAGSTTIRARAVSTSPKSDRAGVTLGLTIARAEGRTSRRSPVHQPWAKNVRIRSTSDREERDRNCSELAPGALRRSCAPRPAASADCAHSRSAACTRSGAASPTRTGSRPSRTKSCRSVWRRVLVERATFLDFAPRQANVPPIVTVCVAERDQHAVDARKALLPRRVLHDHGDDVPALTTARAHSSCAGGAMKSEMTKMKLPIGTALWTVRRNSSARVTLSSGASKSSAR